MELERGVRRIFCRHHLDGLDYPKQCLPCVLERPRNEPAGIVTQVDPATGTVAFETLKKTGGGRMSRELKFRAYTDLSTRLEAARECIKQQRDWHCCRHQNDDSGITPLDSYEASQQMDKCNNALAIIDGTGGGE